MQGQATRISHCCSRCPQLVIDLVGLHLASFYYNLGIKKEDNRQHIEGNICLYVFVFLLHHHIFIFYFSHVNEQKMSKHDFFCIKIVAKIWDGGYIVSVKHRMCLTIPHGTRKQFTQAKLSRPVLNQYITVSTVMDFHRLANRLH